MIDAERTRVLASPTAWCPEDLMRGILGQALGVPRTRST